MEHEFWHNKWQENRIGFHQESIHTFLTNHWNSLYPKDRQTVLVPLCGKSLDMIWLAKQGFHVIGVELSELAAQQFFSENKLEHTIAESDKFKVYKGIEIEIWVGNVFEMKPIKNVCAVYDRAALVALPLEMRNDYIKKIIEITPHAPHLLIVFEYDQNILPGPPFSISEEYISTNYTSFSVNLIEQRSIDLKGVCTAQENCYILSK